MSKESTQIMVRYQREFFDILDEFFRGVTGTTPSKFAPLDRFSEAVHSLGESLRGNTSRKANSLKAFETLGKRLRQLYTSSSIEVLDAAKSLEACKLNVGGSSAFLETHLNVTRKSLLYADTILIPDPLMPWLESDMPAERFPMVKLIQAAFFLLHLKDLAQADFDIPPFFVFPSWEKSLEEQDATTIQRAKQMVADVCSCNIDRGLTSFDEVLDLVKNNEELFLQRVDEAHLFISPGQSAGESLADAIGNYKKEMELWKTEAWNDTLSQLTDGALVFNGICERLMPQYHLLENSDEMRSHPLLCIKAQADYYRIVTRMSNEKLNKLGVYDTKTAAIIDALSSKRLDFLSNIKDSQLVELRKTNENIVFRKELRDLASSLPETKMEDVGYISSEVCSHVEALISKHEIQIQGINSKYQITHGCSALMAAGGLAVTFMPVLAPFLGVSVPFAIAVKYTTDKLHELNEKKIATHSLMGVIALAKDSKDK